jgi:uncharacterized circularly permuted ATP-grasp superfamily protein
MIDWGRIRKSLGLTEVGDQTPVEEGKEQKIIGLEPDTVRQGAASAVSNTDAPKLRPLTAANTLRLRNQDGQIVERYAPNYYLNDDGSPRAGLEELVKIALGRDPKVQARLDQILTDAHAAHEMSFKVKNPQTGAYDKEFRVPVYGSVVPVQAAAIEKLAHSTQPVMRALRELLQKVYSVRNPTAKDLGLEDLPEAEQRRVVDTVKSSVYYEPAMVHPSMKDYPFLAVGGFDASLGNLDHPDTVFFEFNLGTPSGLSNNVQILDLLRENDPEMFKAIAADLAPIKAFQTLRHAVESNAAAWTKNPEGISVVLGPGPYNGAHPDVASIALYTGMPLVHGEDLYQDKDGNIRLDTGMLHEDPVVTGIYGRMEESYFLQDNALNIPIRTPDRLDNEELGKKFGVKLEPGVEYWFRRDDQGEIIGVHKDNFGKPILQQAFGAQMKSDPSRPGSMPGHFAEAVKNKKLYFSGLGGRVVDDKRIFEVVASHLAKRHLEHPDDPIAQPPRTLKKSEYHELYESEDLTKWVIKAPDNSGGVGVRLMCNLSEAERKAAVEEVRRNPDRFLVQELRASAVMLAPENGSYGSTVVDLRLFATMDADGNVAKDDFGILGRAASPFSASTNTSQGAKYATIAVLKEGTGKAPNESVLPEIPVQNHLSMSRRKDLGDFLKQLNLTAELLTNGEERDAKTAAAVLAYMHRNAMDLFGRDNTTLMTASRRFHEGSLTPNQYEEKLTAFRTALLTGQNIPYPEVVQIAKDAIVANVLPDQVEETKARSFLVQRRQALWQKLTIDELQHPAFSREFTDDGEKIHKYEVAVYRGCDDPFVDSVIKELALEGGEVRLVRNKHMKSGSWLEGTASAYFWLNDGDKPIIGIDLAQDYAATALAHELEHFRMWKEIKDELVEGGMPESRAKREALMRVSGNAEMRMRGEKRSIQAEFKMELKDSEFNRGYDLRARSAIEPGYTARICYPQAEGVRELLYQHHIRKQPLDIDGVEKLTGDMIRVSRENQAKAIAHWEKVVEGLSRSMHKTAPYERAKAQAALEQARHRSLFADCFKWSTQDRFRDDGTFELLKKLFGEVAEDRTGSNRRTEVQPQPLPNKDQQQQQQQMNRQD